MARAVLAANIGSLDTQIGQLSVAVTHTGVAAVAWSSPASLATKLGVTVRADLDTDPASATGTAGDALAQLREYFDGSRHSFDLPLDWRLTTGAQRAVLETLYDTVGWGQTVTYGELAARSATGIPARAVGGVMGANPLPIIVACHRVVAASGLGGYSGGERLAAEADESRDGLRPYGLETKRWLLTFEGALPPTLGWDPEARLTRTGS
jgi:methylated-DNA-[protein]-cysteine S-methyltransferase